MSNISKIIDFFEKLFNPKYLKKVRFIVIEFDKDKLSEYNQSVHWFLTCMLDKGKLPQGVNYMGTYGNDETKIEAYYDERSVKSQDLEKFLEGKGIKVKLIQQ